MNRGIHFRYHKLIEKIKKSEKAAPLGEKPAPVKTHYRNMVISMNF